MLDPQGFVSSCNATNFFFVSQGTVMTSKGDFCFNGVTRGNVIRLCQQHNVPLQLGDFTVEQARAADEAFVTGTFGGITPVREIDGRRCRRACPGRLRSGFSALYEALKDAGGVAMSPPIRIAMWSGPRNISTAMMRSFGARPDTAVIDEPFYAAYLTETGLDHPMRNEVLASQPCDCRRGHCSGAGASAR